MKVCCLGGAGFVGRHFTRRLLEDGHDVTVVDNLSTGTGCENWAFRMSEVGMMGLTWYARDCRDFFKHTLASRFDLIVHCAAVVGGRLKIEGDPLGVATDLAIDSDFFNWCVAARMKLPKKVIYFSSSAVYPALWQRRGAVNLPLLETAVGFSSNYAHWGIPDQSYGFAKLAGEYLANVAAKTYGLDVVIYRPFSGYGEDQDETYPFPAIIRRVIERQDPIVIWGSGEQQRDFIHIDDVVEAVLATKDVLKPGDVLNLGSGVGTTFREIAQTACNEAGHSAAIVNDDTKPEGVFCRVADAHRMKKLYQPKVSLVEGIRRSLDFARTRV